MSSVIDWNLWHHLEEEMQGRDSDYEHELEEWYYNKDMYPRPKSKYWKIDIRRMIIIRRIWR